MQRLRLLMGVIVFSFISFAAAEDRPQTPKRDLAIRPQHARVLKDIEYAKVDGQSLTLDLYLPEEGVGSEDRAEKPPLIVWIHGGAWKKGDKSNPRIGWLPDQGFAMASIEYRLTDRAIFPAQIHDCKGAIRWLRAHASEYGYDAERIGVSGGSAGGHLVALLGTSADISELEGDVGGNLDQSSRVQAVVDYFGPSDFTIYRDTLKAEDIESPIAKLLGGSLNSKAELALLASPAAHVTSDDAPILIIHGTDDPLVNIQQSRHLRDIYQKAGLESTLETVEGGGHGGFDFYTDARQKMVTEFFDRHLRQTEGQ